MMLRREADLRKRNLEAKQKYVIFILLFFFSNETQCYVILFIPMLFEPRSFVAFDSCFLCEISAALK